MIIRVSGQARSCGIFDLDSETSGGRVDKVDSSRVKGLERRSEDVVSRSK